MRQRGRPWSQEKSPDDFGASKPAGDLPHDHVQFIFRSATMLRPIFAFAQAVQIEPSCRAASLTDNVPPRPARGPGAGEGAAWFSHEGRELQAASPAAEAYTLALFIIFHCSVFMKRSWMRSPKRYPGVSVPAAFPVLPRRLADIFSWSS